MKFLAFLLFSIPSLVWAGKPESQKKITSTWWVISSTPDANLSKNESKIELHFKKDYTTIVQETVLYAYNNSGNKKASPDKNGMYSYKLKPGQYVFTFFLDQQHFEIITDTILVKPTHKVVIEISFESSVNPIICDKPVIYLYPEKKTNVHVNLNIKGDFLFTYPAYNNGWDFIADSSGNLRFGEKTYNYLFWEGTTILPPSAIQTNTGFCVAKENLAPFFEEKLTLAGFNTKEMADFITYWVPRMQEQPFHKIQFLFTNDFDQYAPLHINPTPNQVYRLFMLWTPLQKEIKQQLIPQDIPPFNRSGFDVLEWGGTKYPGSDFNEF